MKYFERQTENGERFCVFLVERAGGSFVGTSWFSRSIFKFYTENVCKFMDVSQYSVMVNILYMVREWLESHLGSTTC